METVRVFTLNVWSGFRYNGLIRLEEYESAQIREKRFAGLLHEIERLQPDLLALGELNPLFDREKQDVHAGGSGCGCSAAVLCSHILPMMARGELKNVLFAATGALMSPTSTQQGESIPGISHLVHLVSGC